MPESPQNVLLVQDCSSSFKTAGQKIEEEKQQRIEEKPGNMERKTQKMVTRSGSIRNLGFDQVLHVGEIPSSR
jgi:hypothetical protein